MVMRAFTAMFKIPHYNSIRSICVTILAKMRTGVIHADVLADHASTRFALAFVLLRLLNRPAINHVVFRADKIHQLGICVEQAHHQVIIYALVVLDTIC